MSTDQLVISTSARTRKKVTILEVIGFGVVVALWLGFAAMLLFSQSTIHEAWIWFKDLSLIAQIPLGILFLPWLIGMWIWESSWPTVARGLLVSGLAWANMWTFFPWKAV